jgi:hypothetical protein
VAQHGGLVGDTADNHFANGPGLAFRLRIRNPLHQAVRIYTVALAAGNLANGSTTTSPFLDYGVSATMTNGGTCSTGPGYGGYEISARTTVTIPLNGQFMCFPLDQGPSNSLIDPKSVVIQLNSISPAAGSELSETVVVGLN